MKKHEYIIIASSRFINFHEVHFFSNWCTRSNAGSKKVACFPPRVIGKFFFVFDECRHNFNEFDFSLRPPPDNNKLVSAAHITKKKSHLQRTASELRKAVSIDGQNINIIRAHDGSVFKRRECLVYGRVQAPLHDLLVGNIGAH